MIPFYKWLVMDIEKDQIRFTQFNGGLPEPYLTFDYFIYSFHSPTYDQTLYFLENIKFNYLAILGWIDLWKVTALLPSNL